MSAVVPADVDVTLSPRAIAGPRRSRLLPYALIAGGAALAVTGAILIGIDEDAVQDGVNVLTYRDAARLGTGLGVIGIASAAVGTMLLLRSASGNGSGSAVAITPTGVRVAWSTTF